MLIFVILCLQLLILVFQVGGVFTLVTIDFGGSCSAINHLSTDFGKKDIATQGRSAKN